MKTFLLLATLLLASLTGSAQTLLGEGGGEIPLSEPSTCVSPEERADIQARIAAYTLDPNRRKAISKAAREKAIVAFDFPLRKTSGLDFNNYYATFNYVDLDPNPRVDQTTGLLDYNCGERTYDGHKGTDFDTWPFPWYMYDNDFVEVIAAEAGTIIIKTDGNDDDHCLCFGQWNAVYIEHADGSTAWYGHMKRSSLTAKTVGQTVAKGEYLGVVASSGCSTSPHLHFEVYDSAGNLIDPYAGPCNNLNTTSWWTSQPAYREPTLNALLTHDDVPVHGCPGTSEAPNIANVFTPGQTLYTATYYSDQLQGDVTTLTIRQPDGATWQSRTRSSGETFTKSWWYYSWNLPSDGPFGTWTVEAEYRGETFVHAFDYRSALPVELIDFSATPLGEQAVALHWTTATELNNAGFEVQRSATGSTWEKITFMEGQGSSSVETQYEYIDYSPMVDGSYYRLKQLDEDGDFELSAVVFVAGRLDEALSIFPNPTSSSLTIRGPLTNTVQLFDQLGQLFLTVENAAQLDLSPLPAGVYSLVVATENQRLVERVVKS